MNSFPLSLVKSHRGKLFHSVWAVLLLALPGAALADCQPNAWHIDDTSTASGSTLSYTMNLTPSQRVAATNNGWRLSVVSRMTQLDPQAEPGQFMAYDTGERCFAVGFSADSEFGSALTATLSGLSNLEFYLSGNGTAYHTHDLVYDPVTRNATYLVDGTEIHTWAGDTVQAQAGIPMWGGASSVGQGCMNYHRVTFVINGLGAVADYNAGFEGDPAAAPDPASQGWTRNAGGVSIPEWPVSPDAGQAIDIRVTNSHDSGPGSLRAALAHICPGGTITFDPSLHRSTIALTSGALRIDKALTLTGPGADLLAVSGDHISRVFAIDDGTVNLVKVEISGLTIRDGNSIQDVGGGIYNTEDLALMDSTVAGNSAIGTPACGGGIYNQGVLLVRNTTLSGNSARGNGAYGGGVYNRAALTLQNSTLSGNSAFAHNPTGQGGGIFNYPSSTLTVQHCTVTDNSASGSGDQTFGGGICNFGMLELSASILAGNTATHSNPDLAGSISSGNGHNFIGDPGGSTGLTGTDKTFASSGATLEQLLGPLADYGGRTLTHAVVAGSPAIDAGDTSVATGLLYDQRGPGFPRLAGGAVDIGAFEYQDSPERRNAWQITDNSSQPGSILNYSTNLTPAHAMAATNGGFHYTIVSRLVDDFGSTSGAMSMIYGDGTRRYGLTWDFTSEGNLVAALMGGITAILADSGAGADAYHQHELVYDPATRMVTYLFDGDVISIWEGQVSAGQANQVVWGSNSSAGQGKMNFHRVEFAVGGAEVAAYRTGAEGAPEGASDPAAQGWNLNPSSPPAGTGIAEIAPFAPPEIRVLEPSLIASKAQLDVLVDPRGWETTAWVEWGLTTDYGERMSPQFVGSRDGFATFSPTLSSLATGYTYHYRVVAANRYGMTASPDQTLWPLQTGEIRLLCIRANFTDRIIKATNDNQWIGWIDALFDFTEPFYQEQSYGLIPSMPHDITEVYEMGVSWTTYYGREGQLAQDLRARAATSGWDLSRYHHVVISVPSLDGRYGAQGAPGVITAPGEMPWPPGFAHEFGHALGIGHAGACEGGAVTWPGVHAEGVDANFTMGSGPPGAAWNAPMRYKAGWIKAKQLEMIQPNSEETYRLYQYDTPVLTSFGPVALRALLGAEDFWISYAPTQAHWVAEGVPASIVENGVFIHTLNGALTRLLDATPGSLANPDPNESEVQHRFYDTKDAPLQVGSTLVISEGNPTERQLVVTPLATGETGGVRWIDVRVGLDNPESSTPVAEESFDAPSGSVVGTDGGSGWSGAWDVDDTAASAMIVESGLSYPGLVSRGGALRLVASPVESDLLRLHRSLPRKVGGPAGSLWVSFLIETEVLGIGQMVVAFGGNPFFTAGKPWGWTFGIDDKYSPVAATPGTTRLVVLRIDFDEGSSTGRLWLDPGLDDEPADPEAAITMVNVFLASDELEIKLQGYGEGAYRIDEVRVGPTFASVAPRVRPFLYWQQTTEGGGMSPGDDLDLDGTPDILEFAFLGDPGQGDVPRGLPRLMRSGDLTFMRPATAAADLVYELVGSRNLLEWHVVNDIVPVISMNPDGTENVVFPEVWNSSSLPSQPGDRGFYSIQVRLR